jgi:hypothetical protein
MARRKWIQHVTAKKLPPGHWHFGHELRIPTAASTALQHHHPDFFDVSIGAVWISLDFCPKNLHQQGKSGKKRSFVPHVSLMYRSHDFSVSFTVEFLHFSHVSWSIFPPWGHLLGPLGPRWQPALMPARSAKVNIPLDEAKIKVDAGRC